MRREKPRVITDSSGEKMWLTSFIQEERFKVFPQRNESCIRIDARDVRRVFFQQNDVTQLFKYRFPTHHRSMTNTICACDARANETGSRVSGDISLRRIITHLSITGFDSDDEHLSLDGIQICDRSSEPRVSITGNDLCLFCTCIRTSLFMDEIVVSQQLPGCLVPHLVAPQHSANSIQSDPKRLDGCKNDGTRTREQNIASEFPNRQESRNVRLN